MTAVFDLRDVGLRRAGLPILQDVTWTIHAGERWVVLGPNGAGKTTLVRILSTYAVPSTGTIEVLARRIGRTNVAELRPRIGYLSPSLAHMIPERLTPRQIVDAAQVGAVVPWYVDADDIDRGRTERALVAAGLTDAPERPFATFSSGEQLRIQLARALVVAPDALLLDEPMASLDIGGRETLISTLAGLAASDVGAMVAVLHRVEDIPPGFTHALLVREGRVVMAGPLDEALADESMSACFGTPLQIVRTGSRFGAAVADVRQPDAESSSQSIASR
jgi:iron complex transport system ATP-binding protein